MSSISKTISFISIVFLITNVHASDCSTSDATLSDQRSFICDSLVAGQTWWCGNEWQNETKASKDWPSQAVYLQNLINTLTETTTPCTNTTYYKETIRWLNYSIIEPSVSGNFGWTWDVFQKQYYDTPRLPGDRIESPGTLGRKCWAFAYLKQMYNPTKLEQIPYNLNNFTKMYESSTAMSMNLCNKVLANCFVNASFDPKRNGTCKTKQIEFHYIGFERENIKRKNVVHYPWW